MKPSLPLLRILLCSLALGWLVSSARAQPAPTPKPTPKAKGQPAKPTPTPTPTPEPILPGVVIARGDGWMSLSIENGTFRLGFYDAQKLPVAANVARASARWNNTLKTGELRTVLNPSPDGKALIGNQPVRGPYVFKVFLTLIDAEGVAVSSHVIDFRQ